MNDPRILAQTLQAKSKGPVGVITRHKGKVTAVNTGPPKSLDIYLDGDETQVLPNIRYMKSYLTPSVNDIVEIMIDDTDLIILGVLA